MKKIIASILFGAILGALAMYFMRPIPVTHKFGSTDTTPVNEQILKENIDLHVRLGERPKWDPSVVSADAMTQAYAAEAVDKGVDPLTTNLFDALRAVVVSDGTAAVSESSLSPACAAAL